MSDVGLIAIIVAAFGLAIWLVRPLGRLIDSGSGSDSGDGGTEEPPDTGQGDAAGHVNTVDGASPSPTAIDPRRPR